MDTTAPPRPGTIPPSPGTGVQHLSNEELRDRALSASITLVKGRLVLGDCLLEMFDRELYWTWGYSSMNQFVQLFLRIDVTEAKAARFVAKRLRVLPLLREAAEAGELRWTHLHEVCRVATPDTEDEWLAAARKPGIRRLRSLVRRALKGQSPSEDPLEPPAPVTIQFLMELIQEESELQQGAVSALSVQAGRPLTPREAHMELYRAAVEGRIRTSARGVVETEEVLRDMARMRQEQDEREAAAAREEALRTREAGAAETEAPAADGLTSDPAPAPEPDGLTSDLSSEVHEEEPPWLPWAAALVQETACPDNPDLQVVTSSRKTPEPEINCSCQDCQEQRSRHIPRSVRRKVMRRDGFRCQCPDCPNTVWLDLHHIVFWCLGGLSVPPNLVLLCRRCHRNLHLGRLRIRGNADLGLTFLDAEGRVLGSTTRDQERKAVEFADELLSCGHAA